MSMTNKPVEPSMEEILASIRKIIAEEPIGTRPDPAGQKAKPPPKLGSVPEALAIDDVLDMAGGAGVYPGPQGHNGGASNGGTDKSRSLGKPVASPASGNAASASHGIGAPGANGGGGSIGTATRATAAEEAKPASPDRSGPFGATIADQPAEADASADRFAARPGGALSEARQKVERHLGSLPDVAERPAPLGLRSIREPRLDTSRAGAGGLLGRVAAASARAEPVAADAQPAPADKTRAENGAAGAAMTATDPPAKQAEVVPAAKAGQGEGRVEAKVAAATPAAAAETVEARAAEPAKAAGPNPKASLEEAVAEMLRPMLSTWLEANLPRIVQEVVREHVAKTPIPGKDKPAT
jgi:uncharacterized protein